MAKPSVVGEEVHGLVPLGAKTAGPLRSHLPAAVDDQGEEDEEARAEKDSQGDLHR